MNTDQLKTFMALSDTLNFRKAGEMINLTQSAVSAQIKSLEEELCTQLIDRSNYPVSLTAHGFLLNQYAEVILRCVDKYKEQIKTMPKNNRHKRRLADDKKQSR